MKLEKNSLREAHRTRCSNRFVYCFGGRAPMQRSRIYVYTSALSAEPLNNKGD